MVVYVEGSIFFFVQSISDNSAFTLPLDRIRLCKYLALKNKR